MTDTRDALDRMLHDAVLALDDRFADAESAAELDREWRRAEADRSTGRLPAGEP